MSLLAQARVDQDPIRLTLASGAWLYGIPVHLTPDLVIVAELDDAYRLDGYRAFAPAAILELEALPNVRAVKRVLAHRHDEPFPPEIVAEHLPDLIAGLRGHLVSVNEWGENDVIYVGFVRDFFLDLLDPNGDDAGEMDLLPEELEAIQWGSAYLQAIHLMYATTEDEA